jgi:hypothetical protein
MVMFKKEDSLQGLHDVIVELSNDDHHKWKDKIITLLEIKKFIESL